jgi:hypothetical protein
MWTFHHYPIPQQFYSPVEVIGSLHRACSYLFNRITRPHSEKKKSPPAKIVFSLSSTSLLFVHGGINDDSPMNEYKRGGDSTPGMTHQKNTTFGPIETFFGRWAQYGRMFQIQSTV